MDGAGSSISSSSSSEKRGGRSEEEGRGGSSEEEGRGGSSEGKEDYLHRKPTETLDRQRGESFRRRRSEDTGAGHRKAPPLPAVSKEARPMKVKKEGEGGGRGEGRGGGFEAPLT